MCALRPLPTNLDLTLPHSDSLFVDNPELACQRLRPQQTKESRQDVEHVLSALPLQAYTINPEKARGG